MGQRWIFLYRRKKNRFARICGIRVSLQDIEDFLSILNTNCLALSDDKKLIVYLEGASFEMNKSEIKKIINKTTLPPLSIDIRLIPEFPEKKTEKLTIKTKLKIMDSINKV